MLNLKDERSEAKSFLGNAQFDYKFHFLPELRANLNVAMDYSTGTQSLYIDPQAAECDGYGRTGYDKQEKTNKSLDFYLQYTKDFNNQSIDAMVGYAWQHFWRSNKSEYIGVIDEFNPTTYDFKTESY